MLYAAAFTISAGWNYGGALPASLPLGQSQSLIACVSNITRHGAPFGGLTPVQSKSGNVTYVQKTYQQVRRTPEVRFDCCSTLEKLQFNFMPQFVIITASINELWLCAAHVS